MIAWGGDEDRIEISDAAHRATYVIRPTRAARKARRRHQRADIVGCLGVVGMWAVVTALLILHAWAVAAGVVLFVGSVWLMGEES